MREMFHREIKPGPIDANDFVDGTPCQLLYINPAMGCT